MGTFAMDAVILAGGRGTRMGGVDKASLIVSRERMVDQVVAAARNVGAATIIVAGPEHAGTLADLIVREEPPFSGPLAALEAAIRVVTAPWMLVLACDLVYPEAVVAQLVTTVRDEPAPSDSNVESDGVVLVDEAGSRQWLASCLRTEALRIALAETLRVKGTLAGGSLKSVLALLELTDVSAQPGSTQDIDTPEQLAKVRDENIDHRKAQR